MPAEVRSGKVFFDTSVLVYFVIEDDPRSEIAEELLLKGGTISVQVLNELAAVMRRKRSLDWPQIQKSLADIRQFCDVPVHILTSTHESALRIAQRYGFHFYDSLIVASALEAGCTTLYSEDLQHNQKIESLTVINPFLPETSM